MRRFVYNAITGEDKRFRFKILRPVLFFSSAIYAFALSIIKFLYKKDILKSIRPDATIISIGNITWGGTGKTSLVELVSNLLKADGRKVAVIIRGYGADEDQLLKEHLGETVVLSGKDRVKSAKEAKEKYGKNVLILDDGFQHWRIRRDLDIVCINATNPFGNNKVIPAGILREPVSSLKRASLVLLTKVNLALKDDIENIKKIIKGINPDAEIFESAYEAVSFTDTTTKQELALDYIAGKRICAVAAVGDNESFFKMLSSLKPDIVDRFSYLDHHCYSAKDLERILDSARKNKADAIVTTPKDWIRLKRLSNGQKILAKNILLLNAKIKIADKERFPDGISSLFIR